MRAFFFSSFLLAALLSWPVAAQLNQDSLLQNWKNEEASRNERLAALHTLGKHWFFVSPDSAHALSLLLYTEANQYGMDWYLAEALVLMGKSALILGKRDSVEAILEEAYNLHYQAESPAGLANALLGQGLFHLFQGLNQQALDDLTMALGYAKQGGDPELLAETYISLGNYHAMHGDLLTSLGHYQQAYTISSELSNRWYEGASVMSMGNLYYLLKNHDRALQNFQRSLEILSGAGFIGEVPSLMLNLGNVYAQQNEHQQAIFHYKEAQALWLEMNIEGGQTSALLNIGETYLDWGKPQEALNWIEEGMQLARKQKRYWDIAWAKILLARGHLTQQEFEPAIALATEALEYAQEQDELNLMTDATEVLYPAFQGTGNWQHAFETLNLYYTLEDSILNLTTHLQLLDLEYSMMAKMDSMRNADSLKLKEVQLAVLDQRRRTQGTTLTGILLLSLVFGAVVFQRFQVTRRQKSRLAEQKEMVDETLLSLADQKHLVDQAYQDLTHKNKEILDSITYAKRIQSAILPPYQQFVKCLPKSFVFYQPKDIVAGDFYWTECVDGQTMVAAADCTGHGVPGALVSMVCRNGLQRAVREFGATTPGKILDQARELIVADIDPSELGIADGMDIALCGLRGRKLSYAGAYQPLWILRPGIHDAVSLAQQIPSATVMHLTDCTFIEVKADRQPVGRFPKPQPFSTHHIELLPGDTFYIFSDGYADQFGGPGGRKFQKAKLRDLLVSLQPLTMSQQGDHLQEHFTQWMGEQEQLDDVCVIGIRV
ncbi:MAG TPA: hypothetical protein DCE41_27150 [Cytophagales bacterium]|nr:hypothetical protein [Cytophagales bacterium]